MIDIKQIESFYPENLRPFKKNILREYLQYKILEIIFDSKFNGKLTFMGGTALRIVHQHNRFSEDMDFDNMGIEQKDFEELTELIQKRLKKEGYNIEIKTIFKKTFRCYLRINDVLFNAGLSGYKEEKLLIQIDTEKQDFIYVPEKPFINKFDVFLRINSVPPEILLSQKIYAIFKRKRAMGRDFYDSVFLFGKTQPNFDYLKVKIKIKDMDDLKKKLLQKCKEFDFNKLAKDVEPFLFNPEDSKKVLFFCEYMKGL
ncbi:MAG: nucleotidyl transferase AbiEii/AbiGii toxin family protein [Candidatus Firestonebacteria bacterium]|nr:nucleotidyl transferase AbiEii/AbiGii toxin family protein [Candidatus Firestonebacteria bacterium]